MPAHLHAGPYLNFVLAGDFTETDGAARRVHAVGMAALNPPGAHHEDLFGPAGARDLTVRMRTDWLVGAVRGDPRLTLLRGDEYDVVRIISALLREMAAPDECSPLVVESALLEMVAAALRLPSRARSQPHWLRAADQLISDRFREDLRLATVAAEVAVHPVHLARSFREQFGVSIGERIRALRIREACRLLAGTKLPLVEIAIAVGFSDQSHFTRVFSRHLRVTPLQYRRLYRAR